MLLFHLLLFFSLCFFLASAEQNPCRAESFGYDSIVCVCDETYCDDFIPYLPVSNEFIVYTTNQAGLRFSSYIDQIQPTDENSYSCSDIIYNQTVILRTDRSETDQTIIGFGGAFTDTVGYNLNKVSDRLRANILKSFYCEEGLRYNMGRAPIGHSDYSLNEYYYDDTPYDINMADWKLRPEDTMYKIPYIKAAKQMSSEELLMISSIWTVPSWMRKDDDAGIRTLIKEQYYGSLSQYILKYLETYERYGINMYAVSFANEPTITMGSILEKGTSQVYTVWPINKLADFAVNYFVPAIEKYFPETYVLFFDDNRDIISTTWLMYYEQKTKIMENMKLIGLHGYFNTYMKPVLLENFNEQYPNVTILTTEFCTGLGSGVQLGKWSNAEFFAQNIIEEMNYHTSGWIHWTLLLDTDGGPHFRGASLSAPIYVDVQNNRYYKQTDYYGMGHFSKFMPRGSVKISLESDFPTNLQYVAVLRPDNLVAAVLFNQSNDTLQVTIRDQKGDINLDLTANSINTVLF